MKPNSVKRKKNNARSCSKSRKKIGAAKRLKKRPRERLSSREKRPRGELSKKKLREHVWRS